MPRPRLQTAPDQEALKNILRDAIVNVDDIDYQPEEDGSFLGMVSHGTLHLADTYTTSEDIRVVTGETRVYQASRRIWNMLYREEVMPEADREEVIGVCLEAWQNPHPDLPVRGPAEEVEIDGYIYRLSSLHGPYKVGDFVVAEEIKKKGKRVYLGHLVGGWNFEDLETQNSFAQQVEAVDSKKE